GCWVQTWDHHDDQPLKLDEEKNELHGHQSIEIIGPNSLDPSWRRLTAGTLPDTSVDPEPTRACNGPVAARDHSHEGGEALAVGGADVNAVVVESGGRVEATQPAEPGLRRRAPDQTTGAGVQAVHAAVVRPDVDAAAGKRG